MRKNKIDLLKNLINIPSPSGFENKINEFIKQDLLKYVSKSKMKIDAQKNLIVTIEGKLKKAIVLEAHADTIGFIVTNVDSKGLISLQYIGGGDTQILSARHLNILTSKGIVHAVVNRKHSHLIGNEDDEKIDSVQEAQVDIGIRSRKRVLRKIKIGDPVVYQPIFEKLSEDKNQGQFVAGYGFDDKSGCFILIEAIKEIIKSKKKPEYTLQFVFSSKEEIGNPPKKLTRELKPELFVGLDVTFATDYGDETLEKEVGRCELGKGIVVYRGVNIHSETVKLLDKIAKKNRIKIQYQASVGDTGYNATEMVEICDRMVIIAPPLRSMHTPVETINLKDLNYGISLIKNFCLSKELKRLLK